MASPTTDFDIAPVDAAFRKLCAILFGKEVGGLLEFEPYLKECMLPYAIMGGKENAGKIFLAGPYYPASAAFISPQEIPSATSKQFSINDIKDVDSLFRAASEGAAYCGNKTFGRSHNIGMVDNAIDCIDVYNAHNVRNVKKGAYISCVRESEYVFGIPAFPKINYSMRCLEGINANRMFETYYSNHCSDTYYSFNCYSCSDVIFGFNLRGKRHVIGNVQLQREKYAELKTKLVGEMAALLSENKRIFSISDLAHLGVEENSSDDEVRLIPTVPAPASVEKAFAETAKIVLGKTRSPIGRYVPFLQQRALPVRRLRGRFGSHTYRPELPIVKDLPCSFLCTREEALKNSGALVQEGTLGLPIQKLALAVSRKACTTMDMVEGESREVPEVTQAIDSTESWSEWDATASTRSACSTGVIQSKYIFGGYFRILDSEFCVNCYDIVEAKRCFEVDSSSKCSDCYFCHNVEGCQDCILCFSLKGKRYAVLNQEVGKEEFLRVKKMLLDYVNVELDSKKRIGKSIFALAP